VTPTATHTEQARQSAPYKLDVNHFDFAFRTNGAGAACC
jgi:hypothetical protein